LIKNRDFSSKKGDSSLKEAALLMKERLYSTSKCYPSLKE
jgi:hypothetical protein